MDSAERLSLTCPERLDLAARALLVAPHADTRLTLIQELDLLGIEAHVADENLYRALQTLDSEERYALLIVQLDQLGPDGRDFLNKVSFSHPGVRTIILSDAANDSAPLSLTPSRTRKLVSQTATPHDVALSALRSLANHHYDLELVQVMQQALPTFMEARILTLQEPFLRAGSSMLAPITAMTEIAGEGLWGRLLLSTHENIARAYAETALDRPPRNRDELWDALGELTNLFASEVRRFYDSRGLESTQSPPTIIEGASVLVRQASSPLSVVVPFKHRDFAEPLYAEWIISHKSPDRITENSESGFTASDGTDSITFL